jgi:hypothetical protein
MDDVMLIVLMLNLLYGFAIYRHALTSHAFFIQQARLEEECASGRTISPGKRGVEQALRR